MSSVMRFEISGKPSFELRNRDEGDVLIRSLGQIQGLTDGDAVFAYDVALSRTTYSVDVSNIPQEQRDGFQTWFETYALGTFTAFTIRIPAPKTYRAGGLTTPLVITNAYFDSPTLHWTQDDDGWWSLSFSFFTQQEGATGPPS